MAASIIIEVKKIMKSSLHITATVDQPDLLKSLVEKLAYRRIDSLNNTMSPARDLTLDTSSTEAYVSGTIALDAGNGNEKLNIPFITCFLFTCIKTEGEPYELAWSQSLS